MLTYRTTWTSAIRRQLPTATGYQVGAKLSWDPAAEQVTENAAAARLLKREYRAPWRHPATA